ncbi:hypothetical protein [Pantoea agglomerans]|uniref:hypothetical protein n=1 Tax=Enterobacter agglomerans TaxID=549 RepID=UPI002412EF5F|nr:hypothetical protein [Pantoea agglomerans]
MKRELRYGGNVEWFLNDIAAVEMSDIDSGEFEIYGEDEAGRETCTYIDITELAADAAQIISDLRDQLQAAEHLAELRGRQNLDTQRKLDALAAENVALKESVDHAAGCIHAAEVEGLEDALESNDGERLADLIHRRLCHAHLPVVTPVTDEFINSARADELEKFDAMLNLSADKKEAEGYAEIAVDRRDLAVHALMLAVNLRATKDGE